MLVTRVTIPGLEAPDPVLEERIRARLDLVEEALDKSVRSDTDFVTEATSYLVRAGGKRFRPLMVLLAGCFGDGDDSRLIPGAVSIEVTHLATLYHDDVIDEAESRRGMASVNARWDNTVAILTGDFLFARASDIASDLGADVVRLLARTIAILCDGQIREVAASGRLEQTEDAYREIIRRKTAMLIATSCRLGGMLSEAPADLTEVLDRYGMAVGLGFQLSDDIMDVTATEAELRKAPGQDMREGVYTLPVLYALRDGPRGHELRALLEEGPPQGDRLARALDIVRMDGSLVRARDAVTGEVRRAKRLAGELPFGPARDALVHIADFIALRCGAEA
jgi:heptaprenyl diphosphate synthase